MEESGNGGRIGLSEKPLVSEDEAAQLLGVSKPTFRGMVAHGHVHREALPRGIRRNPYRRSDLEAFVESLDGNNEQQRHAWPAPWCAASSRSSTSAR